MSDTPATTATAATTVTTNRSTEPDQCQRTTGTVEIQHGKDGYWIGCKTLNGNESLLNLNNMTAQGSFIQRTWLKWAEESFIGGGQKPQPQPTKGAIAELLRYVSDWDNDPITTNRSTPRFKHPDMGKDGSHVYWTGWSEEHKADFYMRIASEKRWYDFISDEPPYPDNYVQWTPVDSNLHFGSPTMTACRAAALAFVVPGEFSNQNLGDCDPHGPKPDASPQPAKGAIAELLDTPVSPEKREDLYTAARAELATMEAEREQLMLRSVGAMAIAEGDEGWEKIPLDCPMLLAVAELRKQREPELEEASGASMIAEERQRQIDKEGFSEAHDDEYDMGDLVSAAECYIDVAKSMGYPTRTPPSNWPWDFKWWKPKANKAGHIDPIKNLVIAGALIAAEIDRLKRITSPPAALQAERAKPDKKKTFRIAVDFDGTCVMHEYPEIGEPNPGAIEWLRKWKDAGADLYLWTIRSDAREDGSYHLAEAVCYLRNSGVILSGINDAGDTWTTSKKLYAQLYVDDAAAGVPLVFPIDGKPYLDWTVIGPLVMQKIEAWKEQSPQAEKAKNPNTVR